MSGGDDASSFKVFGIVLVALLAFTFFIAIVANSWAPPSSPMEDPLVSKQLQERIQPVGQVRVAE